MSLTKEQRNFYEENGYLLIPKLVDDELIEECRQRFVDICNKKVFTKGISAMKDVYLKKQNLKGEAVISRIQNVYLDEVFSKYVCYKPTLNIVENIIGPNISSCHSLLINKPPNSQESSSRHPLHQDLFFFPFRPTNSIVAVWTAMETVNKENGCLIVVPKSQKMELQPHDYPDNIETNLFCGVLDEDNYRTVDVKMEKGDTIFFHPLLLHGSRPNLSKGYRKALSCHYIGSNANVVKRDDTFPSRIKDEEVEVFKKWGYETGSFETLWKRKCWLVKGSPGKLQQIDNKL